VNLFPFVMGTREDFRWASSEGEILRSMSKSWRNSQIGEAID
jgi:hypothetical protein